jgi:putative addiction module component (TIGR02574 family)
MLPLNARAKKVREEALELPTKARAKLAHDLLLSLEEEPFDPPEDVEKAWAAEIERRIQDVKEGRVKLIPAAEALRDVRASLKRVRPQRAR